MPFEVLENKIPRNIADRVLSANAEWDNDEYQDFDALKQELVKHILRNAGPLNNVENPLPLDTTGYVMRIAGDKGIALTPKNDERVWFVFDGSCEQVIYGRETGYAVGGYAADTPFAIWLHMVFGNLGGF